MGYTGQSATLSVGSVTTGSAGSSATVSNSGSANAAVFDFVIPAGETGTSGTVLSNAFYPVADGTSFSTNGLYVYGISNALYGASTVFYNTNYYLTNRSAQWQYVHPLDSSVYFQYGGSHLALKSSVNPDTGSVDGGTYYIATNWTASGFAPNSAGSFNTLQPGMATGWITNIAYIASGNGAALTNIQATNIVGGSAGSFTIAGTNYIFTNGLIMSHSP
jgi:hypothetical protein